LNPHNSRTTGPIANIQTVLESALQGEGTLLLEIFLDYVLYIFWGYWGYEADGGT
jgi:hypothetical protein